MYWLSIFLLCQLLIYTISDASLPFFLRKKNRLVSSLLYVGLLLLKLVSRRMIDNSKPHHCNQMKLNSPFLPPQV